MKGPRLVLPGKVGCTRTRRPRWTVTRGWSVVVVLQSSGTPRGRMGPLLHSETGLGNSKLWGAVVKHKALLATSGGGAPKNEVVLTKRKATQKGKHLGAHNTQSWNRAKPSTTNRRQLLVLHLPLKSAQMRAHPPPGQRGQAGSHRPQVAGCAAQQSRHCTG